MDIEYNQGIHLLDSVLWFDAPRYTDLCFISHAHVDPLGSHRKMLMTDATAALVPGRVGKSKTLVSPTQRRFSLGDLDLELHPAGHLPGSAQIRVTSADRRLVYTGHFQLQRSHTAEPAKVLECDFLVMEATYGLPHQVFPPREEVEEAIVSWTRRILESGDQPVFFSSPLGKAQELARILGEAGLGVQVHRSIYRICRKYRALGVDLPRVRCYLRTPRKGEVVMFPTQLRHSRAISRLKRVRAAMATGRALGTTDPHLLQLDAAFVLSGHADHPDLLRYVRDSGTRKVYLVGPAAAALAAEIRGLGIPAWPLKPPEQMDLFEASWAKTAT